MAQLAIKGHATRGREVIQLLEMLGGKNIHNYVGTSNECYAIDDNKICTIYTSVAKIDNCVIFTLEEFEKLYPYKVGDKVITKDKFIGTITDIRWQGDSFFVGKEEGDIVYTVQVSTTGQITYPKEDLQPYKKETMEEPEPEPKAPILSNRYDYAEGKCGYVIPDGYEFDSIKQGFQTEIILKPKKQTYPKDYKECCEVIGYRLCGTTIIGYKTNVLKTLQKLLICRDAYWKIAGEEMGLGKAWEQDYDDRCFIIANNNGNIHTYEYHGNNNVILAFPTAEMRDAFFENFKEEIEQCKELL